MFWWGGLTKVQKYWKWTNTFSRGGEWELIKGQKSWKWTYNILEGVNKSPKCWKQTYTISVGRGLTKQKSKSAGNGLTLFQLGDLTKVKSVGNGCTISWRGGEFTKVQKC